MPSPPLASFPPPAPRDVPGAVPGNTLPGDEEFLLQAFSSFAEAAGSLERSYSLLRAEVARLHRDLEESHDGLARSLEETRTTRQHLDRILESLPCGVLVVAGGGEISRVNPEGRRLLAWEGNSDSKTALRQVSELRSELRELLEGAQTRSCEQEKKVSAGPGPERWLAVRHAAVPEGTPSSTVFIIRDISEGKRLEQAEQKLLREQAQAEMSAVLAHEIRNPLGSLELFAGLLAEAELNMESREWVEHLQAGLRTLSATVNNVLHVHSRSNARNSPVDLGQLLDWAHGFLAPLARRARVTMNLRHRLAAVTIPGDRHRLEQVLLNLLLNAVHALPGGGCVELAGRVTGKNTAANRAIKEEEEDNPDDRRSVIITVSDTGPGIAAEHLPRIFEPGFSTRVGSTGMGLTVCRRIVEEHGGTIRVTSPAGRGAAFTLTLPLSEVIR